MPPDRDVKAFDERASRYEQGWLGRLHHEISDRAVELALTYAPAPQRVLDVGSGTGYVLRQLADRLPAAVEFVGIEPAPEMVRIATASAADERVRFLGGVAERLPFGDDAFDVVISTTSFDHWTDQQQGLTECTRVLVPGGRLILTDLFSACLWPTLVGSRRRNARTKARATRLLTRAGLHSPKWYALYAFIIQTVTAAK